MTFLGEIFQRPESNRPDVIEISWVFVIVSTDPLKILVARRKDADGEITLPGGKLKKGEDYKEAAVRELGEEMFIENTYESMSSIGYPEFKFCWNDQWYKVSMFVLFLCELEFIPVCTEPEKQGPWEAMDMQDLGNEIDTVHITNQVFEGWVRDLVEIIAESTYKASDADDDKYWDRHYKETYKRLFPNWVRS